MISYQGTTTTKTLEEKIVDIVNTNGINNNADKLICVDAQNTIHYKTLLPPITTITYTGIFNSATTNETIIFNLPTNILFENIINIQFFAYYNTQLNSYWNNGFCWAEDHDGTISFASGSNTNPSNNSTFKMYRRTARMALAPYKIIISYIPV